MWDVKREDVFGLGPKVDGTLAFSAQNAGYWDVAGQTNTWGSDDTAQGESAAIDALKASLGNENMYKSGTIVLPTESSTWESTSDTFKYGLTWMEGGVTYANVVSRQMQKEALHHAQCAYFCSIVVVQWADLMICKTRWLSIYHQGMLNPAMNFGLLFETILAAYICYTPGVGDGLGTRPIRLTHWAPAIPFSVCIFLYDEARKKLMRDNSPRDMTVQSKQIFLNYGWLARQTYY